MLVLGVIICKIKGLKILGDWFYEIYWKEFG